MSSKYTGSMCTPYVMYVYIHIHDICMYVCMINRMYICVYTHTHIPTCGYMYECITSNFSFTQNHS